MLENITTYLYSQTPLLFWTQSLWRDEAFSVWIANGTLSQIIARTGGDFSPPLYYFLLHYWMGSLGNSEIILRGLSLIIFIFAVIVAHLLALRLFKHRHSVLTATMLFAFNPMLVYYAFELRMYSLLTLITLLSLYFLVNRRFRLYAISAALGLYTHPYMAFVIMAQLLFLFIKRKYHLAVKTGVIIGLLYLPWLPTLFQQLLASGPMWIYPIDRQLVLSVLGNLYTGYEGTPGHMWPWMKRLSILFVLFTTWPLTNHKFRKQHGLFYLLTYVPLLLVLTISYFKPIYVARYLIYVTIGEIFLITATLSHIRHRKLAKILATVIIATTVYLNTVSPDFHRKVDLRTTFHTFVPLMRNSDVIYAETPLVFYETLYYRPHNTPVFLYNPKRIMPPRFVGSIGMEPETWASDYPIYPRRAFVVGEDGSFEIISRLVKM